MFVLYHVFFSPTWGGVPWVYSAEINSLGWRTRGAAAATATNWLMAFVVVQFTKAGVDRLGWAFYLSKLQMKRGQNTRTKRGGNNMKNVLFC